MKIAPLLHAILRWFLCALAFWIAAILSYPLALLACLPCFVYTAEESSITGHPSLLPGTPREFLRQPWKWMTTFDAPADELIYAGYFTSTWYLDRFTKAQVLASGWLRYVGRVMWVWRNPCYQLAQWLGYNQQGLRYLAQRDNDRLWKSGVNNWSYWIFDNDRGQVGFCFELQWFYWGQRCLEVYIGWKHDWAEPDHVCMLVARITPFNRYLAAE